MVSKYNRKVVDIYLEDRMEEFAKLLEKKEKLALVLFMIEKGVPKLRALDRAVIPTATFYGWCDVHLELSEAIKKAESVCISVNVDNIKAAAENRVWTASAWLLERRFPDDFKERTEQETKGGRFNPDEIKKIREELRKLDE